MKDFDMPMYDLLCYRERWVKGEETRPSHLVIGMAQISAHSATLYRLRRILLCTPFFYTQLTI